MASYLSHHKNVFESKIPTNLASFEIGSHKNENKGLQTNDSYLTLHESSDI